MKRRVERPHKQNVSSAHFLFRAKQKMWGVTMNVSYRSHAAAQLALQQRQQIQAHERRHYESKEEEEDDHDDEDDYDEDDHRQHSSALMLLATSSSNCESSATAAAPAAATSNFKDQVGPLDVICGRDSFAVNHPGTISYKEMVRSHRPAYQKATKRMDKKLITEKIIDLVHARGGRFMVEQENGVWVEQNPEKVHDKVSHGLRSIPSSHGTTGAGSCFYHEDPHDRAMRKRKYVVEEQTDMENRLFLKVLMCQQAIYDKLTASEAAAKKSSSSSLSETKPTRRRSRSSNSDRKSNSRVVDSGTSGKRGETKTDK